MLMNFNLNVPIFKNSFRKKILLHGWKQSLWHSVLNAFIYTLYLKLLLIKLPYTAKGAISPHWQLTGDDWQVHILVAPSYIPPGRAWGIFRCLWEAQNKLEDLQISLLYLILLSLLCQNVQFQKWPYVLLDLDLLTYLTEVLEKMAAREMNV